MLFKFASYLLGTNNEEEPKPDQQLNIECNENQDTQQKPSTSVDENSGTSLTKDENLITNSNEKSVDNSTNKQDLTNEDEDDYMYAEQLINCSKLKNSNFNFESTDLIKEDQLGDQLEEDEDYEDDQWIYITPIKRKNEDEKEISEEEFSVSEQEEENCNLEDETSKKNVPKQQPEVYEEIERKEKFNFYDYFNNKTIGLTMDEDVEEYSNRSKNASSLNKSINKQKKISRMEESVTGWVIHPPACFEIDNTFTIEEHPLENALLENPALSIMASCKSIEKENNSSASSLTNSSLNNKSTANRVLVGLNLNSNQTKIVGTRKRTNSTRKTNKKQSNKKSKKQTKKSDLSVAPVNHLTKEPVEQETKENEEQKQVLVDCQLLAHYLMNSNQITTKTSTSNTIASSSNGSTHHQSTNHPHNHTHHHYISNNCVATTQVQKNASEQKKGSKSLKRNNKVVVKRDNLSNRPFTLHRKLC